MRPRFAHGKRKLAYTVHTIHTAQMAHTLRRINRAAA